MIWFGTTEKWFEAFIRRIGGRRLVITRGGEAWLGRRGQLPFQSYCNALTGRRQATRSTLTPNPSTAVPKAVSIIHGANLMHVPRTHPSSQAGLVFPQHSEWRQRVIEVVQESSLTDATCSADPRELKFPATPGRRSEGCDVRTWCPSRGLLSALTGSV